MMFLEEFSNEQAMAIGEIDLSKKLYAFRTIQRAYKNHHVLRITVDAWNNRHRSEVIDVAMKKTLDHILNGRFSVKCILTMSTVYIMYRMRHVPTCGMANKEAYKHRERFKSVTEQIMLSYNLRTNI